MDLKQEVRVLNATADIIENYVNYSVCCFCPPEDGSQIIRNVLPKDDIAKKYFFILLLEITERVDRNIVSGVGKDDNLLSLLHRIALSPKLNREPGSAEELRRSVEEFLEWLSHEFEYDIYSPYISKGVKIVLSRKEAIYLIGNRCKHFLPRSGIILKRLIKLYRESGVNLGPGEEIIILEDIDNWLFEDFGGYHFTKLCELSANVYYGIIQYVRPVYKKSLRKVDEIRYSYEVPSELDNEGSVYEYYSLLNKVRSPFIPIIKTWEYLERKY